MCHWTARTKVLEVPLADEGVRVVAEEENEILVRPHTHIESSFVGGQNHPQEAHTCDFEVRETSCGANLSSLT